MKIAIALAAAALLGATPAFAKSAGVEVGTLTCKSTRVANAIVFSQQDFACSFQHTDGQTEPYSGKVQKIGVDLSVKKDVTIVWTVLAPTKDSVKHRVLVGNYAGAGADVALGGGVGVNVLVGGGAQSFTLQPLSISGIEGVGASVGIQSFELR